MHPVISTTELAARLSDPEWVVMDCRFDLANPGWGEVMHRAGHIPGAQYAGLERDLSGPPTGRNGRHPLPELEPFKWRLGQWGIDSNKTVVCYDQASGMWASRLWWLLRYLGHAQVAVLEGGLARWSAAALPVRAGEERRPPAVFAGQPNPDWLVDADEVDRRRRDPAWRLVDARAPERYRGEIEPIDPVAGHIPGAVNVYNLGNISPAGELLAPAELRARFLAAIGPTPPERVIAYCGSGVAGAHTVLAMEAAGLPGARLYAGSWSEWCADPERPVGRAGSD